MGRIKIVDLPEDYRITKEEMSKVMGGILLASSMSASSRLYSLVLQDSIIMGDPTAPGIPTGRKAWTR